MIHTYLKPQAINGPNQRQTGVALVVSLILLFALSLLGGIAYKSSMTEYKLSQNFAQVGNTFQMAESSIEFALNDAGILSQSWNSPNDPIEAEIGVLNNLDENINATVTVEYLGEGPAYGASIGQFSSLRYHIVSQTENQGFGSVSRIARGATRLVPGI